MSEATTTRWRAIPMERPSQPSTPPRNLKRPRSPSDSEDEGSDRDEDDDVSLVSRSPSPKPELDNTMQKVYNEHMRGIDEEIVTLETKIRDTNIGYTMLQKLGWKDGQGLGARGQGRANPIPFEVKNDSLGLGKASLDRTVIEATVSQRRDLDSERLLRETEEQRRTREDKVAKQAAIKTEVTAVLKPFYCDLCDKQYQTVAQYDEHCNSYAHHHKVREKDLRAAARVGKDSASVRQEKERKREEKELKKIAKMHGVKLTTPSQVAPLAAAATVTVGSGGGWSSTGFSSLAPAAPIAPATTSSQSKGFKSGGWATVGSASSLPVTPNPPAKSGGWAGVGPASTSSELRSANPPLPDEPAPAPPPLPPSTSKAPAFRSSGWTQMDHLTDVKTIVDTESPSVNTQPDTSMDYEMDHTPPSPPPPPSIPPPPPPGDLPPPLPTNGPPPAVAATPYWRTHFAPSPSPSAFGLRGVQSERDRPPFPNTGFGSDAPWTHDPSSPSTPRRPNRQDRR